MAHIRLPHASMLSQLCAMLTFAFAYIISHLFLIANKCSLLL